VEKYSLFIKPSAVKELNTLPKKDLQKIVKRIQNLASNPRPTGCEKLTNDEKYRIRQGSYRIVYSIEDRQLIVWIIKIGLRKDVYRKP